MFNYKLLSPGEFLAREVYNGIATTRKNQTPYIFGSLSFEDYASLAETYFIMRMVIAHVSSEIGENTPDMSQTKRICDRLSDTGVSHLGSIDRICRLTIQVLQERQQRIRPGVRNALLAKIKRHKWGCYICGCDLIHEANPNYPRDNDITLDHLWPHSLGGISEEENLLPACRKCNCEKKRHIHHWAMGPVQLYSLNVSPSTREWESVEWNFKWALHLRNVFKLAEESDVALKDAFWEVGPMRFTIEPSTNGHPVSFFNADLAYDS